MDSWQARFASFSKRKRVKQGSTTTTLKWPHPSTFLATPETLAEAGFYFTPTVGSPDAVQCFTCGKELSDWEADDDPFAEHVRRGSSCCWAIARCGLRDDMNEDGNFVFPNSARIPSSKMMEKARLDSYASHWPHDQAKGHSASSKKMAQAGFVYTPQGPGDDTTTCFYCGTSLSGWEDGDDPLEEHHKREEKARTQCPFFMTSAPQPQHTKPAGRPPGRSQSKPPSANTSRLKKKKKAQDSQPEESPSSLSSDEDTSAPAAPPNSRTRASTSKQSSSTRASGVTTKTPASRKSTRSASVSRHTATSQDAPASETEDDVEASGCESGKRVSKSKKKATGKVKERIEAIQEVEEGENVAPEEQPAEPPVPPKPRRGRPPKNKAAASTANAFKSLQDAGHAHSKEEAPSEQPTHSTTRSKTDTEFELDVSMASSSETKARSSAKGKAKPASTTKNEMPPPSLPSETSKSTGRKARNIVGSDLEEQDLEEPVAKAKVKPKPKPKATPTTQDSEVEDGLIHDGSQESQARQPANTIDPTSMKPKNRKSSSTSDDAGYATAEHGMDVAVGPPEPRNAPASSQAIQDASTVAPQRSNSIDRAPSRQGSVRPGRASSRPASAMVLSSSRLNTEVVDISSSDEETPLPRSSSKPENTEAEADAHAPPLRHQSSNQGVATGSIGVFVDEEYGSKRLRQQSNPLRAASRAPSKGARLSKLVVEVVAPPPSTMRRVDEQISPDIDMADAMSPSPDDVIAATAPQPHDNPLAARISPSATPPPRTPSLPPNDTEWPKPSSKPPATVLPSFDEEMEEKSTPSTKDPLASFTPFLSMAPLSNLSSLPEEDHDLTLEQYIRREIEKQYQQFKEDAERKIALFEAKATETRRVIESA